MSPPTLETLQTCPLLRKPFHTTNSPAPAKNPPFSLWDLPPPFTDATFPKVYVPWNHLTAGFPEDLWKDITASPNSFITVIPYGAGPKFYSENPRADLLLMEFLNRFDFPDKGAIMAFYPVEMGEERKGRNKEEGCNWKSVFDKPWPLIVTSISDDFMRFNASLSPHMWCGILSLSTPKLSHGLSLLSREMLSTMIPPSLLKP
ncbi:uncharacterized protein EV420DRAFT_1649195 [Desarmillaria tabescens]|uniref:Uncharacterized protein n=1 Tax=Armillaria tabescens TaxID=1929756 RepID=A0AA39JKG2_ARMTA|nr:uncharacterized protein EV420DRAFT_1649195 [Desarmillaria tabescens]KAK0443411.1 hypothetical protein EV420DRAFT_1649195 [Desarmillaria tabescens]